MPGLRSLRNRLAIIFALIILGAIGTIYLSVTPRLEASLTSQRLDQLKAASRQYTPDVATYLRRPERQPRKRDVRKLKDRRDRDVRRFAERFSTEVIVMSVGEAAPT